VQKTNFHAVIINRRDMGWGARKSPINTSEERHRKEIRKKNQQRKTGRREPKNIEELERNKGLQLPLT
jgi:hypothetical protein